MRESRESLEGIKKKCEEQKKKIEHLERKVRILKNEVDSEKWRADALAEQNKILSLEVRVKTAHVNALKIQNQRLKESGDVKGLEEGDLADKKALEALFHSARSMIHQCRLGGMSSDEVVEKQQRLTHTVLELVDTAIIHLDEKSERNRGQAEKLHKAENDLATLERKRTEEKSEQENCKELDNCYTRGYLEELGWYLGDPEAWLKKAVHGSIPSVVSGGGSGRTRRMRVSSAIRSTKSRYPTIISGS
ncbi:hypothetical protein M011DRAFT_485823 [Sporormia fimetaria CBS 119925]|uniref:Uncharacterized protein n=1 Tax=Sporormia fimetaria CBS 119925 TaxID=1340428 RepID=A0A6A6VCP1_9PLEO|nr:hypothetical protein M011DRAFT_485823 [Sporormia fimetaria CBS 119925]